MIDDQEKEMEKAVIGRGKYELCEQFKKLEKREDEWFTKMTHGQRQAHLKRLSLVGVVSNVKAPRSNSLALAKQVVLSDKPCCSRQLFPPTQLIKEAQSSTNLSVSISELSDSVVIPTAVLDAIWSKAGE